MKKIIYTLVVALFSFGATAQDHKTAEPAAPAAADNPNAAEITFEKDVHDFGTIPYGGPGVYDFKFTNTGKEPLIISSARGSCGCTVPKWPKEPISKGESGAINVSYDTKRVGPFTKTVTINSNAKSAVKTITIKGTVLSQEQTESNIPLKKDNAPLENQTPKQ